MIARFWYWILKAGMLHRILAMERVSYAANLACSNGVEYIYKKQIPLCGQYWKRTDSVIEDYEMFRVDICTRISEGKPCDHKRKALGE